jgi:hypothetical protein
VQKVYTLRVSTYLYSIVIDGEHVTSQRIQIKTRLKISDGDGEDEDTI